MLRPRRILGSRSVDSCCIYCLLLRLAAAAPSRFFEVAVHAVLPAGLEPRRCGHKLDEYGNCQEALAAGHRAEFGGRGSVFPRPGPAGSSFGTSVLLASGSTDGTGGAEGAGCVSRRVTGSTTRPVTT